MSDQMSQLLNDVRNELKNIIDFNENNQSNDSKEPAPSQKTSAHKLKSNKISPEVIDETNNSKIARKAKFVNITATQNIDEDIQRVRLELKKSYDLLMSASDSLESVDFSCINNRIKDLHIIPDEADLNEIIIENEKLPQLTKSMSEKFKNRSGEFEDIPELKEFFGACNKLQHGLENITSNRKSMEELKKRINWATDISIKRSEEIKTVLKTNQDSEQKVN